MLRRRFGKQGQENMERISWRCGKVISTDNFESNMPAKTILKNEIGNALK